ncbi:ORF MSV100 putative RPO19 homolog (vaccinia A5R), similar to SW:P33813 [Melanoplus sanguinipes entomopoxvirus]|uniref:ORF MSV100 putative RPO19 homolog (Vaccinia A5R), similar to SW:P33813 n=1 Tax=Melanoplus sanguinipes entomopoxvirus TaxID=83191 RepID=Q9YVZ1_MSEPV|nr:ORF MSV100 putative RPO19 homolog (vaccinia A5R), similar to SW:P33813 [Melanoplus sanguinipes entomopoxvirus]AAC97648.1 ORF MSV100 putative RPO19 homolog (vaccinia A5R), similar to SW:P33813 [Melanoplus sanguinipes entomopoxvirus 'O']
MSGYDEDRIELSEDENEEDLLYNEECVSEEEKSITDGTIDEDEYEYGSSETIETSKTIMLNGIVDLHKFKMAQKKKLLLSSQNEILSLILKFNELLSKGSIPLIDEILFIKNYNMQLFNNPKLGTPLASIILIILMNVPICFEKYGKIYNRECINDITLLDKDYLISYYVNLKKLIRPVIYNENILFNKDTLYEIFPLFMKNINNDNISNEELNEIQKAKSFLKNNIIEK